MTHQPAAPDQGQPAPGVLTSRLAATLADHEPGWRLPRRSDIARRHGVSLAEVETALGQLAVLGIVRMMSDGQVFLASPAEALITLDGLPWLGCRIDPRGTDLTRVSRHVLQRDVPEEITHALRLPPGEGTCAIQSAWATDGTVTAVSTTYLPASLAAVLAPGSDDADEPDAVLDPVPLPRADDAPAAAPAALYVEVQPPPPWAARMLRLRPAEVGHHGHRPVRRPGGHAARADRRRAARRPVPDRGGNTR